MALEPQIANGWILFNRDLAEEFFQEMEAFPKSLHDDALDALEGAVSLCSHLKFEHGSARRRKTLRAMKNY